MSGGMKRRDFLRGAGVAGAGLLILPSGTFGAGNSPNDKLNIALIGVGGRGRANTRGVKGENIVALCDVNAKNLGKAAQQFPRAKTYVDWRKCLEQKDIDAVVCSTTDHTHAFVATWALNRDKHVYCEKPLANSVEEARTVRKAYLERSDKVATQMGTQIHSKGNPRRFIELIRSGAIGTVKDVRVWCSRVPHAEAYLPEEKPIPDHIDWDLWLGPAPFHPYNSKYLGGCLRWNRFWDFGSGQIGDMGSHMLDLCYWAMDLRFPTSCRAWGKLKSEPESELLTPWNHAACAPEQLKAVWEHPANEARPGLKVYWYDGGLKPGMPWKVFDREKLFKGLLFTGEKGWLLADYGMRLMMLKGDMTHYRKVTAETLIPPSKGHHQEWIHACKTGEPTLCNFDYSGALIEHNLLALVACRFDKKLEWDAENLKATNCPEADEFISKTYREGWTLNG